MDGNPGKKHAMVLPCIAVIEDNPAVRRGMELLLSVRGCDVVLHDRAAEALAFVRRHRPAVVVVDLHLEYRDAGLDVVQQLRGAADTAHVPIVVWSTDPQIDQKVANAGLEGVVVLSKYGHASVLLAVLNDLAGARAHYNDEHSSRDSLA